MANKRASALLSILKGLLAAAAVTLLGMALIAALVLTARLSDGVLTLLNQLLKALAVVLGVRAAVERGGNRGFFTGMTAAGSRPRRCWARCCWARRWAARRARCVSI